MRYVLILFAFVIISSCSTTKFTPMYNETKSSCSVKALKKFPEILKDKQVNRFRYEKQSTGRTRCQSDSMGGVDCKTRMKWVRIPYIKIYFSYLKLVEFCSNASIELHYRQYDFT